MSAALTAQPGLHSTATAVSKKAKVRDKSKKKEKEYHGGACATEGISTSEKASTDQAVQVQEEKTKIRDILEPGDGCPW